MKLLAIIAACLNTLFATAQNPRMLKDVFTGSGNSAPTEIVRTSHYIFFNAEDEDADLSNGLYRTDGTANGTIKLNLSYGDSTTNTATKLNVLGNKVVFAGDNRFSDGEIWVSDGTPAGTSLIELSKPTEPGRAPVMGMTTMGSFVYYAIVNNANQTVLKRTDGTPGGTTVVYNFSPQTFMPEVTLFQVVGNILYFILYDYKGDGRDELWRSDGTGPGTYRVKDYTTARFVATQIMPAGNYVYQILPEPGVGNWLWRSDGTTAGTIPLKLLRTTAGGNNYPSYAAIGNTLYFAALDNTNGMELWKTDGTDAGTVRVSDINPGAGNATPNYLTVLNSNLYFSANSPTYGNELWKYDGNNVSLVKDIYAGSSSSNPLSIAVSNSRLVFGAADSTFGNELWISDGTTANTRIAANLSAGTTSSSPTLITPGNPVLFVANNGTNGREPYFFNNNSFSTTRLFVNDNSTVGDTLTTAVGNNANAGTAAAPLATITEALNRALFGDTIFIDAGSYTEQVTIHKSVMLQGAGAHKTTIIGPAGSLAPPPGAFTEKAIIQTGENPGFVSIYGITINGPDSDEIHSILIQDGGVVAFCVMRNVNNGPYFRYPGTEPRTALVGNNIIDQVSYAGILFAGANLRATMSNNELDFTNAVFGMGVMAGLDFGALPNFTCFYNKIHHANGWGINMNASTILLTHNSIIMSGNAKAIQSGNPGLLQATCNWFGTTNQDSIYIKVQGNLNIKPWLVTGVDASPAIGFLSQTGACVGQRIFFVNDTTTNGDVFTSSMGSDTNSGSAIAPFFTITRALQAASTGDTIMVDAGTYFENVMINKSVVLRGAKHGQLPGSLINRGNETIIHPAVNLNTGIVLQAAASNITIDGFLLDGDNPNLSGGTQVNGIDVNTGYGVFNNNIVANYLTVRNNIVKNFSIYGIGLFRSLGNTTGPVVPGVLFFGNRVDNVSGRGIVLAYNAYGNIVNNHISRCTSSGTWFSQQYVANLNNSPGIVANNIIEQCNLGMQSSSLNPNASAVHYVNNVVTGNDTAFAAISLLINNTAGVTVVNNKFSTFGSGIYFNVQTAGIPVTINENSFENIQGFVFNSANKSLINGACNWLSTTNQNIINAKMTGNIIYSPWLTNGTDKSPASIGFQPVDSSCNGRRTLYYVNDSVPTGDLFTTALGSDFNMGTPASPFYSIAHAYNSGAEANDTIYVDAGNYDMGGLTYLFNKPMVLLGTNHNISPNNAANKQLLNTNRIAESIIRRVTINVGADNLTIKGFRFNTENSRVINTAAARSNFTFEKNYIYRNNTVGSLASIAFTGPASTSIGANNLQFRDNRFEANDTLFGTNMFLGGTDHLTVDNNAFISSSAMPRRITSLTVMPGNLKRSNNLSITNNYMLEAVSSIVIRNASNINITNNEIRGSRNGIGIFTGNDNMGSILIANNKLTDIFDPTFGNPTVLDLNTDQGTTGGFTSAIYRRNTINQNVSLYGTGNPSPSMLHARLGAFNIGKVIIDSNTINLTGSYAGNTLAKVNGGILLAGRHTNTSVIANDLNYAATGTTSAAVEFPSVPLGVYIQTDAGAIGRIGADAHINIFNNKINGFKIPVGFYDPIDTGALFNNKKGYGHLTGGAVVNINNNSFTNDSLSINNGDSSQIVNANCNWFGSANTSTVAQKISLKTVRFTPFLGSGTDANAAIGFQPGEGTCISLNSFLPEEGGSGQVILLKGFGFTGTSSVKFNGVTAAGFSVTNDTTLVATVPAGAHTGTIQVVKNGASVTSANNFMVIPPLSADTIGICPGSNGVLISNISGSSYQWQMLTDSGFIHLTNGAQFTGATGDTLRLLNIPTEWNGRQFRCLVNGTSFSKNLVLRVANYWTGSGGDTDWNNPLNWGCSGQVPDGNTHVTISSSVTLTAPAEAKSILVLPGNTFTVAPGVSLTIKP